MQDEFESIRVVDEPTAIKLVGLGARTWDKLKARGDAPPSTRLSEYRIGYRVIDIKQWLDARRGAEPIVCRARRRKGAGEPVTA